jgi:hypothetical protein
MNGIDAKDFGEAVARHVRAYVDKKHAILEKRIDDLERKLEIAEMRSQRKGETG